MPTHTVATCNNGGEAMFDTMKSRQLETQKYIFLEYFIDEGLMWGRILKCWPARRRRVDVQVM